jgi:hypothetical protein
VARPSRSRQGARPSTAATESRLDTRSRLEGAQARKLPPALLEASVHNRERGRLLSDMGLLTSSSSSLRARRADAPATRATSPPLGSHRDRLADTPEPRAPPPPPFGGSVILQQALMRGEGHKAARSALPQVPSGRSTLVKHGRVW